MSDDQAAACRVVVSDKKSVFITGAAGCGKSHLMRNLIRMLPKKTTVRACCLPVHRSARSNADLPVWRCVVSLRRCYVHACARVKPFLLVHVCPFNWWANSVAAPFPALGDATF